MPCALRWRDECQKVILCEMSAGWTWADFFAAVRQQHALMDTVAHPVYTIFFSPSPTLTLPPGALQNLQRLIALDHTNETLNVIVGAPLFAQTLFHILHRTPRLGRLIEKYRFVPDLDTAYKIIADYECTRGSPPH